MPTPRFFQRGHASFPVVFDEVRPPRRGRVAALLVLLLAGLVIGIGTRWPLLSDEVDSGRPESAAPLPATGANEKPSLIESAIAHVRTDRATSLAGLEQIRLDNESLARMTPLLGHAEARLIHIYQLIRQGEHRQALQQADQLARDHPNFQLAQLVLGDLLSLQTRPVRTLGDVPDTSAIAAQAQLEALREESRRRIRALTERPPEGYVPRQFLSLAPQSRHAIAIDASRSRLYLFENTTPPDAGSLEAPRLRLVGDYYISVGLQGVEKQVEGDKRTPLGVYYITSTLDPERLPDLYGVGALPINYPNALDIQRGKTGSGIWLHGTPSDQFVRAPQASDGCVVLSNQDLEFLLRTVQIRTTPVVIDTQLEWAATESLHQERTDFMTALETWREARSQGDIERLKALYSPRFRQAGKGLDHWWPRITAELRQPRPIQLKDTSLLKWQDTEETMVVTFGEVPAGQSRGVTRRQYWAKEEGRWRIFFEGNT